MPSRCKRLLHLARKAREDTRKHITGVLVLMSHLQASLFTFSFQSRKTWPGLSSLSAREKPSFCFFIVYIIPLRLSPEDWGSDKVGRQCLIFILTTNAWD